MVAETKKIMGDAGVKVAATCVRVPVLRCHGESVNVEFAADVTPEAAREALAAAPGVTVMDDPANNVYPMPGLLAGTNDTYVGRIRRDDTVDHGLSMWVVADQIRKGAALNAVRSRSFCFRRINGGLSGRASGQDGILNACKVARRCYGSYPVGKF